MMVIVRETICGKKNEINKSVRNRCVIVFSALFMNLLSDMNLRRNPIMVMVRETICGKKNKLNKLVRNCCVIELFYFELMSDMNFRRNPMMVMVRETICRKKSESNKSVRNRYVIEFSALFIELVVGHELQEESYDGHSEGDNLWKKE